MFKRSTILIITFLLLCTNLFTQVDFRQTYIFEMRAQRELVGGNFMLLFNGSITETDALGDPVWSKEFAEGGVPLGNDLQLRCFQQTSDGGLIMTGTHGAGATEELVLIKTDVNGNVLWSRLYGGALGDHGIWVEQTSDGGYAVCGSANNVAPNPHTQGDVLIFKTDAAGIVQWEHVLTITGRSSAQNIKQTADGGYIVTGNTGDENGITNLFMIRLDAAGAITWQNEYNLTCQTGNVSSGREVWEIAGGFIVAGYVGGNMPPFDSKSLLMKVDGAGAITDITGWEYQVGGGGPWELGFTSMDICANGDFVATGGGYSNFSPIYIVRTDANMNMLWSRTYNSFSFPQATSIRETSDNGFGLIDGSSQLLKTTSQGMIHCEVPLEVFQCNAAGNNVVLPTVAQPALANNAGVVQSQVSVVNVNPFCPPVVIDLVLNSTDVNCNGGADGTASVVANGGTAPYQYDWQPGGAGTAVVNNLTAGTYTVTVTDDQGVSATGTVTINEPVDPLVVDIDPVNPICAGDNATLNSQTNGGTPAYDYEWNTLEVTSSIDVSPAVTTTYTVTVTDDNGCTATSEETVTVNPLPAANAANTGPYCEGDDVQLTSNGGVDYLWDGPNAFNSILQNPTILAATVINAGTYTVTVTDGNGCTNTAETIVDISNNLAVNAGSNSPICEGEALNLTSDFIAGANYDWDGPGGFADLNQNPLIDPSQVAHSGTYTVTVTNAGGCTGSATVDVVVNPLPVAQALNDGPYCEGADAQLDGSGGLNYEWNGPGGFNDLNEDPVINNIQVNMSGTYTVSVTDVNGCSATATTDININALPVVSFDNDVDGGCGIVCVNFENTTPNTQSWNWSFGDGTFNNTDNPVQHCYDQQGAYDVSLEVTDINGCIGSLTQPNLINIGSGPLADFTADPLVTSISSPDITFMDQSQDATSWSWDFGDVNNSTSNQQNPVFTYTEPGTYTVTLVVDNGTGCTDTATIEIIVQGEFEIYIPNTFTPNEDEINPTFGAYGIGIDEFRMDIFDRWGNLLYSTAELLQRWDGTPLNGGEPVQQGVYVYRIECTDVLGEDHTYIGHVNLLR